MSIVDDRIHVGGSQARNERLWQTPQTGPISARSDFRASSFGLGSGAGRSSESVFAHASTGDQLWQARIDLVVSSGLSGDAARQSRQDAERTQSQAAFDEFRQLCQDELRPVLECSAEMLHQWGLEARVAETLRDEPARVPRSFDLALWIDRSGDRGPGKLTITATEGCAFVRIKLAVGPSRLGAEVNEHIGTTIARDLSDALVGGLVASLVEQIFS